jgi:hypothetical protein
MPSTTKKKTAPAAKPKPPLLTWGPRAGNPEGAAQLEELKDRAAAVNERWDNATITRLVGIGLAMREAEEAPRRAMTESIGDDEE